MCTPVWCGRYLPPETQVVCVSATLPHEVLEMTGKFMTDPVRVLVKRDELTLEVWPPSLCLPRNPPPPQHIYARTHRVPDAWLYITGVTLSGHASPSLASRAPSPCQATSQGCAAASPVSSVRRDT